MTTMNISLPDSMKAFVDEQVAAKGYGTSSEYVRDLLRREQDRLVLRALLLDGAAAPVVAHADSGYFAGLRKLARSTAVPPGGMLVARESKPEPTIGRGTKVLESAKKPARPASRRNVAPTSGKSRPRLGRGSR